MIKKILLFLLIPTLCFAQEVNEKYSYRDFMNIDFSKVDASEFNNTIIVGSNFYQYGYPGKDIFPDGLINVTFIKCNLDNVKIKDGMILGEKTNNRMIKTQNDGEDWIVEQKDLKWEPKEPLYKNRFIELSISIDPRDIPEVKILEPVTVTKEKEINDSFIEDN